MPDWDSDDTVFTCCKLCGEYFEHDDFDFHYDSRSMSTRVRSRTVVCPGCLVGGSEIGSLDDPGEDVYDDESGRW